MAHLQLILASIGIHWWQFAYSRWPDFGTIVPMNRKRYLFYISQNYAYGILRPLQHVIRERGDEVAWFLEGQEVSATFLHSDEKKLTRLDEVFTYQADATIFPGNIAPTFLPGINVAVFHGFDAGKLDKRGRNDHYKIRNCFDLYCTQGPESTRVFESLSPPPRSYFVRQTGWCALDSLFSGAQTATDTRPTVLFCSTFSKRLSCATTLYETIKQLSQTGRWRWIVQFHPKMSHRTVELYKALTSEHLTLVETDDINPLLRQADVMLCDTSSVITMFLLLNKPVVTFNNISPGNHLLNISNENELEAALASAFDQPAQLMQSIEDFARQVHPYTDGLSSQRTLDAIDEAITGQSQLKRKKPDILRQFKMRKKLRYWKI